MKVLLLILAGLGLVCWGLAIVADLLIGKVERTGKDGL
jgi:hypothetical protein